MRFKSGNLRAIAEMVIGDVDFFPYRSSSRITEFFDECDLDFVHDGSTRWAWTSDRLAELLQDPQPMPNTLPDRFVHLLRVLLHKSDEEPDDPDRLSALAALNKSLSREGYKAYYEQDGLLYIKHIGTETISMVNNPHRPLTTREIEKKDLLLKCLANCSEDDLINETVTAVPSAWLSPYNLSGS